MWRACCSWGVRPSGAGDTTRAALGLALAAGAGIDEAIAFALLSRSVPMLMMRVMPAAWARSRNPGFLATLVSSTSGCLLTIQVWKMEMTFCTDQ